MTTMTSLELTAALLESRLAQSGDSSATSPFEFKTSTMPASLADIVLAVAEHLEHGGQVYGLASHCQALNIHPELSQTFWRLRQLIRNQGVMWLLLADWANLRSGPPSQAYAAQQQVVQALCQPHLQCLDPALVDDAGRLFDRLLSAYGNANWARTEPKRFLRALGKRFA